MKSPISITHIDTACTLIELNGYRILTDPTLDSHGHWYNHGFGAISKKTDDPAIDPTLLHDIDLVLLSHHQHKDNFDMLGKEVASKAKKIISTHAAAKVLDNTTGLHEWESKEIVDPRIGSVKVTATPAQHRPGWIPEFVSGKVIGFVLEFTGMTDGVIYITGDTVYFEGIEEVARRYQINIGIYHVGAVQFRYLTGLGHYTMDGKQFLRAVRTTKPRIALPIHYRGWTHFKQSESSFRNVISKAEDLVDTIQFLVPGRRFNLY